MLSTIRKYRRKKAAERSHQTRLGKCGIDFLKQVRTKKLGELLVFKPDGYQFPIHLRAATSDIPTFYQCIFNAEYDLELSKNPSVIVDLGANIGLTSIFFKTKYPKARIIAVEPEDTNFEILRKNTVGYSDIVLYHCGIWFRPAYLEVIDGGLGHYGFVVKETDSQNPNGIPAKSISQIMEEQQLEFIDLLKVDIEGSELELFSGNSSSWLKKVGVLVIELHDRMKPGCAMSLFNALQGLNYRLEIKGENIIITFNP